MESFKKQIPSPFPLKGLQGLEIWPLSLQIDNKPVQVEFGGILHNGSHPGHDGGKHFDNRGNNYKKKDDK